MRALVHAYGKSDIRSTCELRCDQSLSGKSRLHIQRGLWQVCKPITSQHTPRATRVASHDPQPERPVALDDCTPARPPLFCFCFNLFLSLRLASYGTY